jgi:hypothetical protein
MNITTIKKEELSKINFTESRIEKLNTEYFLSEIKIGILFYWDENLDYEIIIKAPFKIESFKNSFNKVTDPRFHFTISSLDISNNLLTISSFAEDEIIISFEDSESIEINKISYVN